MKLFSSAILFFLWVTTVGSHETHEPHQVKAQIISVSEVESVFQEFDEQRVESSFLSFNLSLGGEDLTLQFSVKDGKPGFDWLLLAKKNVADRVKFLRYAKSKGFVANQKRANGISYLRIEVDNIPTSDTPSSQAQGLIGLDREGSLPSLCMGILIDMYGLALTDSISLFANKVRLDGKQY